jgi:hypothetical protein
MSLTVLPHNHYVAFESFGVRIALLSNDSRVTDRLRSLAPAESRPIDLAEAEHQVTVKTKNGLRFTMQYELLGERAEEMEGDLWIGGDADVALALAHLEKHVGECIGLNAPEHVFVRGGAVLYRGRAIVVAGAALSGTTTLLEALVRAGATAFSDTFAVFDGEGRAVSYSKGPSWTQVEAQTNGGAPSSSTAEVRTAPVGAVVETSYTPGATWEPQRLSGGARMLALLAHAVPGEERPKDAMAGIARVLDGDPVVMRGERGEADEVAPLLLAQAELQGSGAA